jgi:hypothetical protein
MLTKRLTGKKPWKRGWGAEIVHILKSAHKSRADLARELAGGNERTKPTHEVHVSRFLSGARTPRPEHVQEINRSVGALVALSAAQSYLDAHARFDGLLDLDPEAVLRDELGVFELIGIVVTSHWERFVETTGDLSDEKRGKFLVELHRLFGKLLFEFVVGRQHFDPYHELRRLFSRYGIDLDALIRGEGYGTPEQLRFNALYRTGVVAVLTKLPPHPSAQERLDALREIERLLDFHSMSVAVKSQGPQFLFYLWQAIESGKPFRWPPPKSPNKNRKGSKS